jgi:hypothetical protein
MSLLYSRSKINQALNQSQAVGKQVFGVTCFSLAASSETSVYFKQAKRRCIQEHVILDNECAEDEFKSDWRRLRNEELHNFYFLSHVIIMIMSRRMRWE